jgi:hypothetical protein
MDLMLEHRQQVLVGIRDELGPHGFDADITYRDWMMALQRIMSLSTVAEAECVWSAPLHPNDKYKTPADWKRLAAALEKARARLDETREG